MLLILSVGVGQFSTPTHRQDIRIEVEASGKDNPELIATALPREQRGDCIFIDFLRNAYGQTSICPYSVRPTANASIATPTCLAGAEQP